MQPCSWLPETGAGSTPQPASQVLIRTNTLIDLQFKLSTPITRQASPSPPPSTQTANLLSPFKPLHSSSASSLLLNLTSPHPPQPRRRRRNTLPRRLEKTPLRHHIHLIRQRHNNILIAPIHEIVRFHLLLIPLGRIRIHLLIEHCSKKKRNLKKNKGCTRMDESYSQVK